ncbi:riboflavin biosynthesis protein RibD [Nonlabens sp. YIK11]|uniref:bifunctional diaminohydroxyphosphoribosylaminopyrimidine deaminase/5-amino-6-(5-phosphoribosylamino)uracil reductase RibD n=1 Tax=Nonlabens sp. YIK11 TaxID=1453349 RepID=UPI0006DC3057|nr:bifunctional diaminohydroxyphosphoribosylaminopyrimidine deaminase/5-amino-6-(5-phosphoribosylamino)uracil reductase RibD [Nonlabens sp. YIK11]KQC33226.1 riboflavin biosynthesis protein RibD [Nonlabens sp. YIK11]
MTRDEFYIQRCIQLAVNGLGTTYPNPLVGSVIVSDEGIVLGEGFHLKSGEPHAEVNAIAAAERNGYATSDFEKATIYVNLEPCSHHGKTPPCASLIIEKKFKKVVIGTLDPHEKVAGKGAELLRAAGVEVITGILEEKCNDLNKRFFTYHKKQRPYIILKWAETADGFIAPATKDEQKPVWITNSYSRQHTHRSRAQENSILIGAQTALDDNPNLTVREWYGNNPIRIVLDSRNDLPENLNVFNEDAVTQILRRDSSETESIIQDLYHLNIQSVIVEGGAKTLQQFLEKDLWDEIHQYMGTTIYFKNGLKAPLIPKNVILQESLMIKDDVLKIFKQP